MKISSKLNDLKPTDLNCNVFDVYSYDGLSMQDLLCQFFTKINECIKVSNETIDLTSWLINEGLEQEIVEKLVLWLNDGTLENLINVDLFKILHTKIENINSQLTQKANLGGKIDISQLDTNGSTKITQEYLSDELLSQMAGTTPLLSEVADKSINFNKLAEGFKLVDDGKIVKNIPDESMLENSSTADLSFLVGSLAIKLNAIDKCFNLVSIPFNSKKFVSETTNINDGNIYAYCIIRKGTITNSVIEIHYKKYVGEGVYNFELNKTYNAQNETVIIQVGLCTKNLKTVRAGINQIMNSKDENVEAVYYLHSNNVSCKITDNLIPTTDSFGGFQYELKYIDIYEYEKPVYEIELQEITNEIDRNSSRINELKSGAELENYISTISTFHNSEIDNETMIGSIGIEFKNQNIKFNAISVPFTDSVHKSEPIKDVTEWKYAYCIVRTSKDSDSILETHYIHYTGANEYIFELNKDYNLNTQTVIIQVGLCTKDLKTIRAGMPTSTNEDSNIEYPIYYLDADAVNIDIKSDLLIAQSGFKGYNYKLLNITERIYKKPIYENLVDVDTSNNTNTSVVTLKKDTDYSEKYEVLDFYKYPIRLSWGNEYLHTWYTKILNKSNLTILTAGDSVTYGYGLDGSINSINTRERLLKKILVDGGYNAELITTYNGGHGNRCYSHWCGAINGDMGDGHDVVPVNGFLDEDMAKCPDLYVISYGINDIAHYQGTLEEKVAQFSKYLNEGLARIRGNSPINGRPAYGRTHKQMSIILTTPITSYVDNRSPINWTNYIRPIIQKACRDYQCGYVDISASQYDLSFSGWSLNEDKLHSTDALVVDYMSNFSDIVMPILFRNR